MSVPPPPCSRTFLPLVTLLTACTHVSPASTVTGYVRPSHSSTESITTTDSPSASSPILPLVSPIKTTSGNVPTIPGITNDGSKKTRRDCLVYDQSSFLPAATSRPNTDLNTVCHGICRGVVIAFAHRCQSPGTVPRCLLISSATCFAISSAGTTRLPAALSAPFPLSSPLPFFPPLSHDRVSPSAQDPPNPLEIEMVCTGMRA